MPVKTTRLYMLLLTSCLISCTAVRRGSMTETPVESVIFPKGEVVKSDNFTGTVWLHPLFSNDTTYNLYAGSVHFERGSRTNWHYHPGGQILLVISGVGRYQEKGKAIRVIRKGDVIQCPPNTIHWHGASPASGLTHIAIGTNPSRGSVVWLAPVTDEEYGGG